MPVAIRKLQTIALYLITLIFSSMISAAQVSIQLIDQKGDALALAQAVIYAKSKDAKLEISAKQGAQIVQQNRSFDPQITVITVGSEIAFPNRDEFEHHVFSFSKPKSFELPLYRGDIPRVIFDKVGEVAIGCNIHDWMSSYVLVLDTPLFTLSQADGSALLVDLVPGQYRLFLWHPRLNGREPREWAVAIDLNVKDTSKLEWRLKYPLGPSIKQIPVDNDFDEEEYF